MLRSPAGMVLALPALALLACAATRRDAKAPRPAPATIDRDAEPAGQSPPGGELSVHSETDCVDAPSTSRRLAPLVGPARSDGGDLHVTVSASPREGAGDSDGPPSTLLSLTVERSDGTIALEREYKLEPQDCGHADDLLVVALGRFFASFPVWVESAREGARAPSAADPARGVRASMLAAINSEWAPLGADADLGAAVDVGLGSYHLGASAIIRATAPLSLGSGHFQQTALLGGARFGYDRSVWQPSLEVRAGALLVSGYGFASNQRQWLPWLEGVAGVARRWPGFSAGLQVGIAPVAHRAVTEDLLASRGIPSLRVGVFMALPIWASKK